MMAINLKSQKIIVTILRPFIHDRQSTHTKENTEKRKTETSEAKKRDPHSQSIPIGADSKSQNQHNTTPSQSSDSCSPGTKF
jgi:hypothetical protein